MLWNQIALGLNATVHLWAVGPGKCLSLLTWKMEPMTTISMANGAD